MKKELNVYVVSANYYEDGYDIQLISNNHEFLMNEQNLKLGTIDIEFELPREFTEDELILHSIRALKEKQSKTRAQAESECSDIQEEINKLSALEYIK